MEILIPCAEDLDPPVAGSAPEWGVMAAPPLARPDLHAGPIRDGSCPGEDDPEGWCRVTAPMRAIRDQIGPGVGPAAPPHPHHHRVESAKGTER